MTPTQLKAKVKNISREKEVDPQLVLRHFMMEKFLEKISESPYRENFVLKGGFLIGSKYGIENRTTKDIDTTLREMKVTKETLTTVLNDIFSTPTKEGIQFEIQGMKETREADYYPGFSLRVLAHLENMRPDFKVDVTTGDSIYPATITHSHSLMMDLLIPVITFIDGISLGVTENPLVNRIAKGSLFLVFVYLVCSYLLKRAGKDNSFWRLTKVTIVATAVRLTAILPLYM